MKTKKLLFSTLALFGLGCLAGGAFSLSAKAATAPTYTKLGSLEGKITASSTLGDNLVWELSKLANEGRGCWSAQWGYTTNPSADEWIRIELPEIKTIGKIALHNEAGNSYARKFVVFGSLNGDSWFELSRYEDGDSDWVDDKTVELEFAAAEVRYIKISLREKGLNGSNYLVSMSNIEVFETNQTASDIVKGYTEIETGITADATLDGSSLECLWDGISADQTSNAPYWTGGWKSAAATDTDELIFDAGEVVNFGGISLFPRCATASSSVACSVYGFPEAFSIYASADGENYTLVSGQTYSGYSAELSWNDFFFAKPVSARYVKFSVTKRGSAGGAYLTQLAEAKAWRADFEAGTQYTFLQPETVTSSGSWTGDTAADKACDGNLATSWVAPWGYSSHKYANEYICYDLGASRLLGRIELFVGDVNVPAAFRISVSEDGETYGVLLREDSAEYDGKLYTATFDSVNARFVKVEVFEKGLNGANYLAGFSEIKCYETDDAEALGSVDYFEDVTDSVIGTKVTATTEPNAADKLLDGITANTNAVSNYWMSDIAGSATVDGSGRETGFDGFYFKLEKETKLDAVWLFPRFDGAPGSAIGFPVDFSFVYSSNGAEWYEAYSCENYAVKPGWNEFVFPGTVTAQYIGVYVKERGKNGELYTIELAEAKIFKATAERAALNGALILDSSEMIVTEYRPAEVNYTYEQFKLRLSEHFAYSLPGELQYTLIKGGGAIEQLEGEWYYILTPEAKGNVEVEISCKPAHKDNPTATLSFTLNVISKEDPDVIVKPYHPGLTYSVGVTLRVDLRELFVYEGADKLVYGTDKGRIEEIEGGSYLVYTQEEAGEITISVTAMPEGKEGKKATNAFVLPVTAKPAPSPEQPPVYGPTEAGCGSFIGGGAYISAAALCGVAAIIAKKRKEL